MKENSSWDIIIKPKAGFFNLNLKELFKYKDLVSLFVYRDFVSIYKQTILGPLWFFVQPILTTITFTVIFGNFAKISTDGLPPVLFYMAGVTLWNYYAECINTTSSTFIKNQTLFGKVYFPRIVVPVSIVINNLLKFFIQFLMFALFWCYYYFISDAALSLSWQIILLPLLIFLMAILGMGIGMIVSSLTTKYRDLTFLISFGVQLMMYASPVVYPISSVPDDYVWMIMINPMSSIIELFKHAVLGQGFVSISWLLYSIFCSLTIFILGIFIFNKVEKSFIDTV
jgi:lipopolysaccharide transport system permease protein